MVAAMAPSTVKAEPHVLTISQMDAVTAGVRGWRGSIGQSNRSDIRQVVSASASCNSNCTLTVAAAAVATVNQSNSVD
jgi:hypothetical protein